jgi:hypothetical protein
MKFLFHEKQQTCMYLFICGLFNNAINSSDYIASNDRIINE